MGEELARQSPVDADMVMPVPESGVPAAQGYARASGIPYGDGFVKNRYVGRTFIQPSQKQRGPGVRLKLNPLPENIRASGSSSSTTRSCAAPPRARSIALLREAGAAEVHFRVSSPPYRGRASTGSTPAALRLLAADMSVGEIRDFLGVDSLAYLDLDRLITATGSPRDAFCTACLTGEYPCRFPTHDIEARARATADDCPSSSSSTTSLRAVGPRSLTTPLTYATPASTSRPARRRSS
jgi:amidophosphoribosyltransferase